MINHTVGVVLVGGASVRMGRDKAAVELEGVTLLERAAAAMSDVFASVVVSGDVDVSHNLAVIGDRVPGLGPLGGLDAAYRISDGRSVFLLAVDMPFVDAPTLLRIAEPEVSPLGARLPVASGRRQPLCAVYGAALGPTVSECLEGSDRSMARMLASVDVQEIGGFDDEVFTNVNTAKDLEVAITRSGRRRSTR